jgi:hypothetical protein
MSPPTAAWREQVVLLVRVANSPRPPSLERPSTTHAVRSSRVDPAQERTRLNGKRLVVVGFGRIAAECITAQPLHIRVTNRLGISIF